MKNNITKYTRPGIKRLKTYQIKLLTYLTTLYNYILNSLKNGQDFIIFAMGFSLGWLVGEIVYIWDMFKAAIYDGYYQASEREPPDKGLKDIVR